MPIRAMQRFAELRQHGEASSIERRKILEEHQATIAEQIVELQRAHKILEHKITNYKKIELRTRIQAPMQASRDTDSRLVTA